MNHSENNLANLMANTNIPQRSSRLSSLPISSVPSATSNKNRQLAQLHSQLAQLSANLADLDNLVRMTAQQAHSMRDLGAWSGGLFMAAAKVLSEEADAGGAGKVTSANSAHVTHGIERDDID